MRARPRRCGARRDTIKQCDHVLHFGAIEALGDEHDLAAMVRIRPALEPGQVMQKMLGALDHRRAIGIFGDIDDAFHAQKIRPEILLKRVEQKPQSFARDGFVAREAEGGDVAIMQMVMIVTMIVTVMRIITMRMTVTIMITIITICMIATSPPSA